MADRAYSYEELGDIKRQILDICERVKNDNPTAWRAAHNGNFDETSTRFNDLCVQALRAVGIFAGCNGKRGGDQRSDDILAFGLSDGRGAQDRSGRFPSMAIIDYINGAGGPNPSLGWNDVSAASPGKFLDPQGLARVDGGGVSGPVAPPQPGPPPPPLPPPPPSDNVARLLEAVLGRLDAMERQQAADTDQIGKWMVEQAQGVVQSVRGGDADTLTKLDKWLRSRRALSF